MLTPAAYFIIIIIINSQGRALKSFPFEAYLLTITFATYLVQYITQKYLHNGKAISRIRFSLLSTLLTFKFHIFCTLYLCFNIINIGINKYKLRIFRWKNNLTRHWKDIIIWYFILTSMENLMDEYTFNYDSYWNCILGNWHIW